MSAYSVEYSDEALDDLRGIYEHIAFFRQSPDNARGQVNRIRKAIYGLDNFPNRYPLVHREPWASMGVHRMNVDDYAVLFYVDEVKGEVSFARVPYGGRDIDKFLEDELA